MEFKKRTIIWEENTEPPKNYIWVRPDGKIYEYNYIAQDWIESESVKVAEKEEPVTPDEPTPTPEPVEDVSYQYLLKTEKCPKYFWMYNPDETKEEIFGSDIEIGGDWQSPNGTRLVVPFSKLSNIGTLARFVSECHIGYIGFGFIWEKKENFELTEGDVKSVQISSNSGKLQVTINYYDSQFEFDPEKVYETEIDGTLYYEYKN